MKLKTCDVAALSAKLPLISSLDSRAACSALELAAYAHDGVFRKECRAGVTYTDPYISHPLRNALRVARYTDGVLPANQVTDLVISSLLHDTVEDAPKRILSFHGVSAEGSDIEVRGRSLAVIETMFGSRVSETVWRVSSPLLPKDMDRASRDAAYMDHLRETVVEDMYAWITKASDMVDNAGSLKHMDPSPRRAKLAGKYVAPVQLMVDSSDVVSVTEVRDLISERLAQVSLELADLRS